MQFRGLLVTTSNPTSTSTIFQAGREKACDLPWRRAETPILCAIIAVVDKDWRPLENYTALDVVVEAVKWKLYSGMDVLIETKSTRYLGKSGSQSTKPKSQP
jgi:hypothetical protein